MKIRWNVICINNPENNRYSEDKGCSLNIFITCMNYTFITLAVTVTCTISSRSHVVLHIIYKPVLFIQEWKKLKIIVMDINSCNGNNGL